MHKKGYEILPRDKLLAKSSKLWVMKAWGDDEGEWMRWENEEEKERILAPWSAENERKER